MFPTPSPAMSPEDVQTLRDLAGRYGSGNLAHTIRSLNGTTTSARPTSHTHMNAPARNSALSTLTFGSNNSTPSLTSSGTSSGPWSSSGASISGSDAASMAGSYFSPNDDSNNNTTNNNSSTWVDTIEPAFLLSPTETSSFSGSEWQDQTITACDNQAPPARKPIECPMCAVYDVYVGFGRKSDFKKHLQNFHGSDCIWVCPHDNCRMVFDFEKAYITHFKIDHGDTHPPAEEVKLTLCPQVVFACGFIGCKHVLEASNDSDASTVAEKHFDHVASHFDKRGGVITEWTYYHQVQNLLRQRSIKDEWKHTLWDKTARNQLRWQPRSSGDLKKLLETRHLADVPRILHAAWTLGQSSFSSPDHPAPEFPGEATRPLFDCCSFAAKGHSEMHMAYASSPGPQTVFSLRRSLFPVKLATVCHPPPRCIPDEPDSLEYAHPGTPLVLPERDDWCTNVVLGPPEDEQLFDPMFYPGSGLPAWSGVQSLGELPGAETFGSLLQVPQPKERLSWGKRSLDNLRLKRRSGEKSPPPTWI